jgi:hypothetical protein
LRLPRLRQTQGFDDDVRTKHWRAHDAGAKSLLSGGQHQVLRGHRGALHSHQILGVTPPLIRILVHVAHVDADHDHSGRFRDPRVGAGDIGLNRLRIVTIRCAIPAQATPHGGSKGFLAGTLVEDGKAPRLPVVGGGSPRRGEKHTIDDRPVDRCGQVTANGTALADHRSELCLNRHCVYSAVAKFRHDRRATP